ncbi:hypothetical protein [Halogeometricum luteum]|uniref:Uncharacterized protein n=1 Tax=Halogeometricum luteum TaxID=2950537 RepID=A0ABU2FX11_9EURY|nr:hypothetical protein [Halogeometricum sp. S3BR5-2]MDS0293085.1 hypothetical protein [Halogeometricum sp. S3BR5-2]
MVRNRLSRLLNSSGSESRLRGSVERSHLTGLTCVLVGASQLPLAFSNERSLALFVTGSGGWLLISIGVNLFRGRGALDFEWTGSERAAWLGSAWLLLFGLLVVAATGAMLSGV